MGKHNNFIYWPFVVYLVLTLFVVACGKEDDEENTKSINLNPNGSQSLLNPYTGGSYSTPATNPLSSSGGAGNATGTNLSSAENFSDSDIMALTALIHAFSSGQQNDLKNALRSRIAGCTFLAVSTSTQPEEDRVNCGKKNLVACFNHILRIGRSKFLSGFSKVMEGRALGSAASLNQMLSEEISVCASVNPTDFGKMQQVVEENQSKCRQGDIRACIRMILMVIRMFFASLMMAFFGA